MSRSREVVRSRCGGRCEVCGRARGTDFSHRIALGMGGAGSKAKAVADAPSNGLYACRPCHREIEANPTASYGMGWKLRRGFDPLAEPAFIHTPYAPPGWFFLTDDGLYVPK